MNANAGHGIAVSGEDTALRANVANKNQGYGIDADDVEVVIDLGGNRASGNGNAPPECTGPVNCSG